MNHFNQAPKSALRFGRANMAPVLSTPPITQLFGFISASSLVRAHLDLLGQQRRFEVGLDDNLNLQFGAPHLPDQRNDSKRQDDVFSSAVPVKERASCYKIRNVVITFNTVYMTYTH